MAIYRTAITSEPDNIFSSSELRVNNAGYYYINDINPVTERPDGRLDYQLIFIKSGQGRFAVNGEEMTVGSDRLVLYRPYEPQHYRFFGKDRAEIYWIHFSGKRAEEYIEACGFKGKSIIEYDGKQFADTVNLLINEFRRRDSMYEASCAAMLISLFVSISRLKAEAEVKAENADIDNICKYISNNYFKDLSNDEYAQMCNMSTSYFLKQFKKITGITPHRYKILRQIENAKSLIISSNHSFEQISQIVGFSSPMYFCRIFKRITGMTPTEFKNSIS